MRHRKTHTHRAYTVVPYSRMGNMIVIMTGLDFKHETWFTRWDHQERKKERKKELLLH